MQKWIAGWMMAVVAVLLAGHAARAEGPEIGKPAPAFELKDTAGKTHKLADYKGQVVVIHFQSIKCPIDAEYQPILTTMAQGFMKVEKGQEKSKVVFLAINANTAESVDDIKAALTKHDIGYPVLKDLGNKIADAYDAKTTPHMYVIDTQGVLRYKGNIEKRYSKDDGEAGKAKEQYLEPAINAVLQNSEVAVTETKSYGCGIKREKTRLISVLGARSAV